MRKWISLFLCMAVLLSLAGCGGGPSSSSGSSGRQPSGVNAVTDAGLEAPAGESELAAGNSEGIDVDLTVLSSTMVYSEVYNMMIAPEDYIGKTVKMNGSCALYHDEDSDKHYYACIVADATACCSQGIEFSLTEEYKYPDDYPEEGEDICVTGIFDTYQEGDYTYCTLRDARLV